MKVAHKAILRLVVCIAVVTGALALNETQPLSVLRRIGPRFLKTFPPRVPLPDRASACPNRWPSV
jgi:hypothetical protein